MLTYLVVAGVLVAALSGAMVWRRRHRPRRGLTMNDSYERAKGQAYLQAENTRNNIGSPFQ